MNPKISVVLPVYNVEKYIEKCLETVINQTYQNLEIILVDDGSTDSSGQICDAYADKDERIRVIHKANGGLSDARNVGAASATGEYLTYIDSDDYVTLTYVEYLYGLIQKYKTKVALCTHIIVFENGKNVPLGNGTDEMLDVETCLERMLYHDVIDTSAWAKMFTMDLAKKIQFPKGKLFEDIGTTYRFWLESGQIACGYEPQYFYIIRKNSIVTGAFNMKKLDLLEMTDSMARDVEAVLPSLKTALDRRKIYARFSTLNQMQDVDGYKEERDKLISYIRMNGAQLLTNNKVPKRDKWAFLLLKISYPLYRLCWKLYN